MPEPIFFVGFRLGSSIIRSGVTRFLKLSNVRCGYHRNLSCSEGYSGSLVSHGYRSKGKAACLAGIHVVSRLNRRQESPVCFVVRGGEGRAVFGIPDGHCAGKLQPHRNGTTHSAYFCTASFSVSCWDRNEETLHRAPSEKLNLKSGELVQVKSVESIRKTLDGTASNRGLWFSPNIRLLCGQERRVEKQIEELIVDGTGEMRTLKSTVCLEGSHCGCARIVLGGCLARNTSTGERSVRGDEELGPHQPFFLFVSDLRCCIIQEKVFPLFFPPSQWLNLRLFRPPPPAVTYCIDWTYDKHPHSWCWPLRALDRSSPSPSRCTIPHLRPSHGFVDFAYAQGHDAQVGWVRI